MTEYPEWLIDRVAKAIHDRRVVDEGAAGVSWDNLPDWAQGAYGDEAVAVLDALRYRELRSHPGYWAGPATSERTINA